MLNSKYNYNQRLCIGMVKVSADKLYRCMFKWTKFFRIEPILEMEMNEQKIKKSQ